MALTINNEVVRDIAIKSVEDNLLQAQTATNGAISIDESIHKGHFLSTTIFDAIGDISRRDITVQTPVTKKRLADLAKTDVKLYFKDLIFYTYTELAQAGADEKAVNVMLGEAIGRAVARWILERALIVTVASIGSEASLVTTAGTADITIQDISKGIFAFGDKAENIVALVSPSTVVAGLLDTALSTTADAISYGATYGATIGTLNRPLWQVDSSALDDGGKPIVIGLAKGSVVISESEKIFFKNGEVIDEENAGVNMRTEGAYTLKVKGFSYDQAQGVNPDDAILGASATWSLVGDKKACAGVLIKGA